MTPAAKSVAYFGIYLYVMGFTLFFAPNMLLLVLHMPETKEIWIRIVGVLTFCIGFYYHRAGLANITSFFPITIPTRILVFVCFTLLVLIENVSPVMVAVGAVDLAGAMWTWRTCRKSVVRR